LRANVRRKTSEQGRTYILEKENQELYLPSVSTVIDQKPEPEGLKYWRKKYDGTGDKKHWEDILNYKGNRGTLIHYNLLNQLTDRELYGEEEEGQSKEELQLSGEWLRFEEDKEYAEEVWEEIKQEQGINKDSVLYVECFVTNTSLGYAGQFDLLYVDKDSNIVLSDIKTSKRVYDKHRMQLTAYSKAIDLDIDVLEVIRIHPDSESYQISRDTEWSESRNELWEEFYSLRKSMGEVESEMKEIAEKGVDDG